MGEPMTATTAGGGFFPSLDALEVVLWPTLVLAVFVCTAIAGDLVVALAARWRMLHRPARQTGHALPTARGGGIVVAAATTCATLLLAWRWPTDRPAILMGVLVPSLVFAITGLLADSRQLPALARLAVEVVVAAWITATLGPIAMIALPGAPPLQLGSLAWPVTMLWILVVIESLAALDHVDGMVALTGVIGGTVALVSGWMIGSSVMVLLAAFVAAASGGLLVFNWDPSRIVMGRSGSGFVGTMLAAIPLAFRPTDVRSSLLVPMVLCLWPLIVDLLVSMPFRIGGRAAGSGERAPLLIDRLTRAGATHAQAVLLCGTLAAAGGLAGVWACGEPTSAVSAFLPPLAAMIAPATVVGAVLWLRARPPAVEAGANEPASTLP